MTQCAKRLFALPKRLLVIVWTEVTTAGTPTQDGASFTVLTAKRGRKIPSTVDGMGMYEIVFRRSDGTDDVVLTNADPRDVARVTIHGERWDIVKAEPGKDGIEARLTVAAIPLPLHT